MNRTVQWTVGFLAVTFAAVAMEVYSVVDGRSWTRPWTDLIVGALPAGVGIPLVIGFASWLCVHFISRWLGHPLAVRWSALDQSQEAIQQLRPALRQATALHDVAHRRAARLRTALDEVDALLVRERRGQISTAALAVGVKDIMVGVHAQDKECDHG